MNVVFELGGDLVRKEVAHNLMRLIAEGVATRSSHDARSHDSIYLALVVYGVNLQWHLHYLYNDGARYLGCRYRGRGDRQ